MPVLPCHLTITGTATRTVPLWRATRSGKLVRASYAQELDTDGDKTLTLRNATKAVNMSSALDIDALAVLGHGEIVVNADTSADFDVGDLIVAVYTVNTAGTVAPGEAAIALDVNYGRGNDSGLGG